MYVHAEAGWRIDIGKKRVGLVVGCDGMLVCMVVGRYGDWRYGDRDGVGLDWIESGNVLYINDACMYRCVPTLIL